jgi:ABC-2 type transport system permease protein
VVGVFASLKWRLVTSRLRSATGAGKAGMLILLVVSLIFVGFLAVGLAALRTVPDIAVPVVTTVFALQLLAWILAPLVAFGVDETVDPTRFALLPLRSQTLQRGLLVTSLIGLLPLLNMVLLVGAAIGIGVPWSVLPIAVLCAAVQLVICVVLSRAASTSMSALMTSRRGRDLGMGVGFLIFLLYFAFITFINNPGSTSGSALESGVRSSAGFLTWSPPGALANLPGLVASGEFGKAGLAALIGLGTLGLAWWWWSSALRKSLTTVSSMTESSSPAGRGHEGSSVAVGTVGTLRVVADRDRLLVWRDPMRRMPWLTLIVLVIAWPFIVLRGAQGGVFAVAAMALFVGAQAANQYGVEGTGLWLHLQTITDRVRARGEVLGHAVAVIIPGAVIVLLSIAVQAVVSDDLDQVPAAIGLSLAALLGGTAVACYLSARVPYAQPQSRKSMFASSVPGQKGRTLAATLGLMGGGLVLAIPAGVAVILSLTVSPLWGWVALIIGPFVGVIALWIAAGMTADRYLEHAPEIFATVSAGDRV